MKHGKTLAVILAILIVSSVVVVYLNPSVLDGLKPNTIASITTINVDPQGSVVGNQYTGSFWNIQVYVTANDDLVGVVLPEGQTGSITYQGATKALETGAKVELKIDPGTPYLIRTIQEKQVMVAPGATGSGVTTNPVYMRYYDWGESTWRIYTPFTVSVYKDGSLVGQRTLNMQGASAVQTIDTSEGAVRIENLGILGGAYTGYTTPSQIAIIKGYSNVYDYTQIQSAITSSTASNAYSTYWFGSSRNSNGQATNPTVAIGGSYGNVYAPSKYGGWSGSDYGGAAKPVTPVIGQQDKSSLPSDERSFYSVLEYVEQKMGVSNLASSLFNTQSTGNYGSPFQKASMVTDANGQTALRLDIPWSAFGTPLVNIRIPTELADTFIDQPVVVGDIDLSASWVSTGSTTADLYGSNRIAVTVTNKGTVTGSTKLAISSSNSKLSVTPLEMTVNNLEPNVPQIVYFDATNLGVENEVSSIPVTITASDTYTGQQSDSFTLYGTLKPTLVTGTSQLILHVVEKGSSNAITGLQLNVQYGNQNPTVYPDQHGTITLTLTNPQGGAYVGQVVVTSADTTVYKTATSSYNFDSAKIMEKTFEVERKDMVYPDTGLPWWIIAVIIGLIVAVVIAVVVAVKGKKRRRR